MCCGRYDVVLRVTASRTGNWAAVSVGALMSDSFTYVGHWDPDAGGGRTHASTHSLTHFFGPLVHSSVRTFGPLVHWSIHWSVHLVHWSIGPFTRPLTLTRLRNPPPSLDNTVSSLSPTNVWAVWGMHECMHECYWTSQRIHECDWTAQRIHECDWETQRIVHECDWTAQRIVHDCDWETQRIHEREWTWTTVDAGAGAVTAYRLSGYTAADVTLAPTAEQPSDTSVSVSVRGGCELFSFDP